jgi:hypothetical protein
MKFGSTGFNFTKKIETKPSIKPSNLNFNANVVKDIKDVKDVKKKTMTEGLKKSFAKGKYKLYIPDLINYV